MADAVALDADPVLAREIAAVAGRLVAGVRKPRLFNSALRWCFRLFMRARQVSASEIADAPRPCGGMGFLELVELAFSAGVAGPGHHACGRITNRNAGGKLRIQAGRAGGRDGARRLPRWLFEDLRRRGQLEYGALAQQQARGR